MQPWPYQRQSPQKVCTLVMTCPVDDAALGGPLLLCAASVSPLCMPGIWILYWQPSLSGIRCQPQMLTVQPTASVCPIGNLGAMILLRLDFEHWQHGRAGACES